MTGMRRVVPVVLLLALAACAQQPTAVPAPMVGWGQADQWGTVSAQSLEKWASFPVDADPRPLVLLGERVNVKEGFTDDDGKIAFIEGRVDADGKVPPEAAEAFAQLAKPAEGNPRIKVLSVHKGTAAFPTDRGGRDLPAWIFELTQTLGPVAVLAIKPEYEAGYATFQAKVSADGVTLTVTMAKASPPCPGEPRITLEPQWLESATAVAVGLKQVIGPVEPGEKGNCAHDAALHMAEYPIRLDRPLGNRVLVDSHGNPMPAISS
jgi:hypothetical protein